METHLNVFLFILNIIVLYLYFLFYEILNVCKIQYFAFQSEFKYKKIK
jgi:hypothetical protein